MNNLTFRSGDSPHPGSIKESFWRDTLTAFAASGQSIRAFCQERGLCVPTFYAWRLRLAQRGRQNSSPTSAPSRPASPAFLPVVVEPRSCMAEDSFQVDLRGGRVLRLPASMPAARLAEVLHALEGQL